MEVIVLGGRAWAAGFALGRAPRSARYWARCFGAARAGFHTRQAPLGIRSAHATERDTGAPYAADFETPHTQDICSGNKRAQRLLNHVHVGQPIHPQKRPEQFPCFSLEVCLIVFAQ
jgi:hypothetical protein